MRPGSIGASLLIHALILGAFVIPGGRRSHMPPPPQIPPQMVLIELAKLQAMSPTPDQGTIRYPKKKKAQPPVKVAAKPDIKPTPQPTPRPTLDPNHRVFEELRRNKQFANLTDEAIRKMPLPPGMKDWKDVLAMTQSLDKLDWTQAPPDTGKDMASASIGGFFGWAPPQLNQSDIYFGSGDARRELVNGTWRFAFQYFGTVMVAEWRDGSSVAKVAYYPIGGKPDETKTFDISVRPTDEEVTGEMIAQFTLISQGKAPQPVPTAVSSAH